MRRRIVVFPEPEPPRMILVAPSCSSKLTPASTGVSNARCTSSNCTMGSPIR
jgi:hypothetical protein